MDWVRQLSTRPILECTVWLLIGLALATAPLWQADVIDAVAGQKFTHTKGDHGGTIRYVSGLETALGMFEVLGASAAFGFAIGALAGAKRGWGIVGLIVGPYLFVAYLQWTR